MEKQVRGRISRRAKGGISGAVAVVAVLLILVFVWPGWARKAIWRPAPRVAAVTPTTAITPALAVAQPTPTAMAVTPTATPAAKETPTPRATPTTAPATATPKPTATPLPSGEVTAEALNLRSGAGTDYKTIKVLRKGERLRVLAVAPDEIWVKVVAPDGTEGWVHSQYLTVTEGALPTPTVGITVTIRHPFEYRETGVGNTSTWTITVPTKMVLIVGGFVVDGVSGGVYKTWPGGQTVTIKVTDGFALVIGKDWAREEFEFRVQQAKDRGWAHGTILPLN